MTQIGDRHRSRIVHVVSFPVQLHAMTLNSQRTWKQQSKKKLCKNPIRANFNSETYHSSFAPSAPEDIALGSSRAAAAAAAAAAVAAH